jgi:hypothetical protein
MKLGKYIEGLYGVQTNIDLIALKKQTDEMYNIIKEFFKKDKLDYDGQSTLTTQLFGEYNLLLYPFPIFHDLYFNISTAFHLCYRDLFKRNADEKHFMQCWLNYYRKGDFIDWHGHHPPTYRAWHGFMCVDTEPNSYTSYRWPNSLSSSRKDLILDIPSKNGLIVMGTSNGDLHKSSEWAIEDRPRITIAFDIVPATSLLSTVQKREEPKYLNAMREYNYFVNHWIPI